jgi:hypothetical protein
VIERALAHSSASGERFYYAESLRVLAHLEQQVGHADRAEAVLNQALAVAREQQAKWFELRVATDIADLERASGRDRQARALLEPLLDWFSEGFDTPDYVAAREVFNHLVP